MSARMIIPAVSVSPAPAPATKRAHVSSMNDSAHPHQRLPAAENHASGSQRHSPAKEICNPPRRNRGKKPCQTVDSNSRPDRGLANAKRLRVQRQHRNDRAKPQLIHRNQNTHPDQHCALTIFCRLRMRHRRLFKIRGIQTLSSAAAAMSTAFAFHRREKWPLRRPYWIQKKRA